MATTPGSPSTLMGFVHRRRRGAELFLLVLALGVGVGGYAAVGLGVEGKVPADIIGYGGWLAALMVGAHVVVRLVAPYADPVLLPVVAALNGLGLAVIHRLDLADGPHLRPPAADLDDRRRACCSSPPCWCCATTGCWPASPTPSASAAIVLLLLPMLPGIGKTINGARIWIGVGPFSFQPGEVAKVLLVVAFAGYLVLHRDALALAGRRVLFVDLPRGRDLGPIVAMWLVSLGILVFQKDLGSSLLFFGLFLIMLYVATERPGWIVVGGGDVLRRARPRPTGSSATSGSASTPGCTRSSTTAAPPARTATSSSRACSAWPGAGCIGRGFGEGDPAPDPLRRVRLHHRRHRRGARPDRGHRRAAALRPPRRARPAHRGDLARRLRQADGHRPRRASSRCRSSSSSAASPG